MRILNLGFDFDGLFIDCGKMKVDALKSIYGLDLSPARCNKKILLGEGHLTRDQYRELRKIIYSGIRQSDFPMEEVEGVLEYIPRLVSDGHKILVITSRSGAKLEVAKEWCARKGLKLDFIGVGYGKSKAEAAKGLDFFVDDDLDKLEPLVGVVPHRFLFSWGYNEHLETGNLANRVSSWEELYNKIKEIALE